MSDELLAKITELTNTVKENGGLNGLRRDELVADFKELLDAQQKAWLEAQPERKGEPGRGEVKAYEGYQGRYKGMLKSIVERGAHREGSYAVKGVDLFMAEMLMRTAFETNTPGAKPPSDDLVRAVKALSSTGSATGDELVPTNMAGELWSDFFLASRIAADLPSSPMPSDPFDVPLGLGDVTWRKGTQNTATTASDTATAKSTLTSTEQIAEVNWSYNLDEDAVIAMMPALRQRLAQSGGEQMDAFVINADATNAATGNINLDDADPADDSYYLTEGQDGLRHLWLVDNTGQGNDAGGDALADADMVALLKDLGKWGFDLNSCRIVPDVLSYFAMLGLTNVATVDKFGPAATILNGELAKYRGIPVVPSASMPLTEADGKCSTTAGSNTLGQITAYNRNGWRIGYRRGLTIEVDRSIQKRQLIMVVSFRIAVAAYGTRSTVKHTSGLRNILV